nr:hypothetical protein [Gorillibacterium massiliense]
MVKAGAAKKKKEPVSVTDKNRFNMKIVTSDVCEVCKMQCERGIRYMKAMRVPGAVGNGVPCILTKGKGYK